MVKDFIMDHVKDDLAAGRVPNLEVIIVALQDMYDIPESKITQIIEVCQALECFTCHAPLVPVCFLGQD